MHAIVKVYGHLPNTVAICQPPAPYVEAQQAWIEA